MSTTRDSRGAEQNRRREAAAPSSTPRTKKRRYWMFSTMDAFDGLQQFPARRLLLKRLRKGVWPLGSRTPYKTTLRAGDVALLYVGGNHEGRLTLVGELKILEPVAALSPRMKEALLSEPDQVGEYWFGVRIGSYSLFARPVPIKALAGKLSILPYLNSKWGTFVRGGIRRLTAEDYAMTCALAGRAGARTRKSA